MAPNLRAESGQCVRAPLVSRRGSFWRASAHTFGISVASVVVGLLTTIILARAVGPDGKGRFDLVMATSGLFGVALGFALPAGATYAIARGFSTPGSLLRLLMLIALAQGIGAAIAVAVARLTSVGPALIAPDLASSAPIAVGCLVAATAAGLYAKAVLLGRERIVDANWRDLFGRLATALLLGIAAFAVSRSTSHADAALVLIWAAVLGAVVTLCSFVQGAWSELHSRGPTGMPSVVSFAAPSALANLVQFLNYRMDLFLVAFFLGPTEVGLYALAGSIAQLIWLVSQSGATALLPNVAASREEMRDVATHSALVARVAFTVSLAAAIGMALVAGVLVPFIYGDRFAGSVPAILWLLPGVVVFAPVNIIGAFMAGIGRPRLNLIVSTVSFVATLVLDLILIPRAGIIGAAIASSASYSTAAVMMFGLFTRITGLSPIRLVAFGPADARNVAALLRDRGR